MVCVPFPKTLNTFGPLLINRALLQYHGRALLVPPENRPVALKRDRGPGREILPK